MAFSSKQVLGDILDWTQVGKGKAVQTCLEQAKVEKRKRLNWGGGGEEVVAAETQRCPRCNSTDTKFCYYNNYNKSQPRHLCRACKRHWTVGGTLRDVPVGGPRKSKRSRPAKTTSNGATMPAPTTPFLPLFTEINNCADDDHLYDDALDVSDEIFPFGPDLTNVGSSSSTSGELYHELPMAGSDGSWSSDLLPVGFLESSSWNWEELVQCLSTDQQTCSFTF